MQDSGEGPVKANWESAQHFPAFCAMINCSTVDARKRPQLLRFTGVPRRCNAG
jgi:hypothetical protein